MFDVSLIHTIARELASSTGFERVPESNLIMDAPEAVAAFRRAGAQNGVLSGVYTYHLAQSCALIRPGDRVIDLGCGPANLLVAAARLNPESTFTGIDLSPRMIDEARKLVKASGLRNVELRLDDITKLELVEDSSVDVVLSSMALHHLADVESLHTCLMAIDRVLTPKGKIYICDFGRLKSLGSVEYFVRRAIPEEETILRRDYYESLRAAFSKFEFKMALLKLEARKIKLYSTLISPIMIVITTDHQHKLLSPPVGAEIVNTIKLLPRRRRQDLQQLRFFLRLGGLKWTA